MSLREYLESVARYNTPLAPYHNVEHFVLENGRPFTPAPFPKGMRLGRIMSCFGNSHRLAKRKRLIYVEGYALKTPSNIGIHHAWCTDESGIVIDPTWGQGIEYFGIPLDFKYARQNTSEDNMSVLDQWQRDWPIFNDPPESWQYKGVIRELA